MTELENNLLGALKSCLRAGIGNSTDFHLQRAAYDLAVEAIAAAEAAQPDEVQRAVEAEREARKAAQLETIAIREELTKRAMLAESEAYQRGVRDEREACVKTCEDLTVPTRIDDPLGSWVIGTLDCANAIRARSNKHTQSGADSSTSQ